MQQAGENALQHARAQRLVVGGQLRPNQVDLTVEDDGLGFNPAKLADLAGLEAQGHFGLAGMQERAALIGAPIQFETRSDHGTRVRVTWQLKPD